MCLLEIVKETMLVGNYSRETSFSNEEWDRVIAKYNETGRGSAVEKNQIKGRIKIEGNSNVLC